MGRKWIVVMFVMKVLCQLGLPLLLFFLLLLKRGGPWCGCRQCTRVLSWCGSSCRRRRSLPRLTLGSASAPGSSSLPCSSAA